MNLLKLSFSILLLINLNLYGAEYEVLDRIVASVEKDVITKTELNKELDLLKKKTGALSESKIKLKNLEEKALDNLIEKKLIIQFGELKEIIPDEKEIDLVINNIISNNNISLEILKNELELDGSNITEFKENLIYQLTIQKIKDREIMPYVNISEYEISAWLNENKNNSDIEYKIIHILIKHSNPKKDEIINKINEKVDKNNFETLAEKFSEGPNAEKNGDLGWNKINELPEIFKEFINKAKDGDISEWIQSPNGLHLLKLDSIKNKTNEKNILVRQYKFQQILLKNNAITNDDELENKLKNIKNNVNDGLLFSEAVKNYSDDQFNNDPKNLVWINFNDLIPEFRNKLDAYPKQNIIGPFKTELGWHLVKVYDFQEADITSSAEKEKAKIAIARKKTDIRYKDWLHALKQNSKIKYFEDE